MTKLDSAWAIREIDAFLQVTAQVVPDTGPGIVYFGTVMNGSRTEAAARAHVVEKILDRALPGWSKGHPVEDKEYNWLRGQASRAKAALERQSELAEKLGENAPNMDAANLHRWAWENGKSYWNHGHYHQAVMQAAIRVNAVTQAKLSRLDVSETALFNEAFSLSDPKRGAPRLRLMEDDGSKTFQNLHRGARAFAEDLYAAIRNPGMHVPHDGGEEQGALEQLAAFILLTRWVDQATVMEA
ncbi:MULTISPECIES: TIGR02391 family protein [Corynebacterium]|uniref:TIGR02391 family protein n=1 Tax=Corynebacterium TaxID=1716 RepID=UPI00124E9CF0|nr:MULTISPECIES: TIGR02391 family protein [Corynebacterium]